MTFEVSFNPSLARWIILGAGIVITFIAWNTSDSGWAFWRSSDNPRALHLNEPRGDHNEEHFTYKESDGTGGLRRGGYLLFGLALIALGLFGPMIADALGIRFVSRT